MGCLTDRARSNPSDVALEVDRMVIEAQRDPSLPMKAFGLPLAGSVLPWIDSAMSTGQTREEWKGMA
jgi:aspartate-semialdehyde dehydrogenase